MFRTIEKQGGSGGPQWLSDHPNPGNRVEYITAEAQALRVARPIGDSREFQQVQAHLRQLPKAPTTEEATRSGSRRSPTGTSGGSAPVPGGRVEPPASSFRTYDEGNLFRVSVPANWRELQGGTSSVTFAPEGAYGQANGQNIFTHGVEFGVGRNETHDLQTATQELLDSLARGNPNLSRPSRFERVNLGDRRGLRTTLSNRSEASGGTETIQVITTQLRDGNLFYAIQVAPRDEFSAYRGAFERIAGSLQFTDR
jgi:hypothetical protein